MANPIKITQPFATLGDKNTIPNSSTDTGIMTQALGFPERTGLPITQNGVPPQREDFNGAFYMLSAHNFFLQSGNLYEYDASLEYAVNAVVIDSGVIYICKKANGASNKHKPSTDTGTYWQNLCSYIAGNIIDDTSTTATDKAWSASKLNGLIGDLETLINAL